ncbi:MAG: glycosyltransferase family 4 protein [Promethearchaeota archaeon]
MKIAFVLTTVVPRNSIGRIVLNLAKIFKKRGHEIQIFTLDYDSEFIKRYEIEDREIIRYTQLLFFNKLNKIPIFGYISQLFKFILFGIFLLNKFSKKKPDIINSHYYLCGITGYIVSKVLKIPHILTFHGIKLSKTYLSPLFYWTDYLVTNYLKNNIFHFISVDPCIKATRRFKRISNKIKIIYPCLDAQFIEQIKGFKPNHNLKNGLKLIYAGRIEKQKGLKRLITILAEDTSCWVELNITGSGTYQKIIENLSKQLFINHKINFTGFLNNFKKIKQMINSDIFISYSKSEGFPLVILEFFALGKPCIIYPISPFADEKGNLNNLGIKFRDEKLGIFLKSEPNYLLEILKAPQLLELFTSEKCEARKQFIKNFYPEKIANNYLSFFKSIIKKDK